MQVTILMSAFTRFCSAVIEGRRSLEAGDFMTFLYGDEYVETCLERGLFRSPFLMRVSTTNPFRNLLCY